MVVGTVAYLAPEAAFGMDGVDARSDLYALGLVLYLMLAGRPPWDSVDDAALFAHQRFTPPPPFAAPTPERDLAALWSPLLDNLNPNSIVARHALRYPLALAVVFWLFPKPFGYWTPLTVTVALKPYV